MGKIMLCFQSRKNGTAIWRTDSSLPKQSLEHSIHIYTAQWSNVTHRVKIVTDDVKSRPPFYFFLSVTVEGFGLLASVCHICSMFNLWCDLPMV